MTHAWDTAETVPRQNDNSKSRPLPEHLQRTWVSASPGRPGRASPPRRPYRPAHLRVIARRDGRDEHACRIVWPVRVVDDRLLRSATVRRVQDDLEEAEHDARAVGDEDEVIDRVGRQRVHQPEGRADADREGDGNGMYSTDLVRTTVAMIDGGEAYTAEQGRGGVGAPIDGVLHTAPARGLEEAYQDVEPRADESEHGRLFAQRRMLDRERRDREVRRDDDTEHRQHREDEGVHGEAARDLAAGGAAYSRKKSMYPSSSTTPTMFVMKGCSLHGVTNAYTAQHAREVGSLLLGGWSVQGGECKST